MKTLAQGTIEGPEANGAASLVHMGDEIKLVLKDYWIAPGAPDVRVYLSPHTSGSVESAVDLGPIHQHEGSIEFLVSQDTFLESIKSVVIFCKVYSVTFGIGLLHPVREKD